MTKKKDYQLLTIVKWKTSTSGETMDVVNPSTEDIVAGWMEP